jgi:hypothetical protein
VEYAVKRVALRRTAIRRKRKAPAAQIPPTVRFAIYSRDGWTCQRCGRLVDGVPFSIQHRKPRGMGGRHGDAAAESYDMANLVLVCGDATTPLMCHNEIEHSERGQAYDDGWLLREHENPRAVACLTYRGWEQPGETWEIA